MRKFSIIIFSVLLVVMFLFVNLPAAQRGIIRVKTKSGKSLDLYKDYHALVVGVSNYDKWPDLPNAVKDATEVAKVFNELGCKVKLIKDPTYKELRKVLYNFTYREGREKNRALLFYYAGHGDTEVLADGTRLGYIIPKDCPLIRDDPQGFAEMAVSMKDIEAYSLRIHSKHVLMLFDSCFSGSLFSLVRAAPEHITEKSSLPVRQYITAGREDETVPDKSMFKKCLLLGLKGRADLTRDGYITGSELGMYLSDKVVQYTRGGQHPQYGKINNPDLDSGDFVFASKTPSQPSPSSLNIGKLDLAEERKKLEQERRELEEMKALVEERKILEEERKRLEAEKKEIEVAKLSPKRAYSTPSLRSNEINGDHGTYIAYANGIVRDKTTGLEWVAGPNTDMSWYKARDWVESLNIDGGGWRMPTIKELKTLFKKDAGDFNMTPLLKTTEWRFWSGEIESSLLAWRFDFFSGLAYCYKRKLSHDGRAFAVRSRSDG